MFAQKERNGRIFSKRTVPKASHYEASLCAGRLVINLHQPRSATSQGLGWREIHAHSLRAVAVAVGRCLIFRSRAAVVALNSKDRAGVVVWLWFACEDGTELERLKNGVRSSVSTKMPVAQSYPVGIVSWPHCPNAPS